MATPNFLFDQLVSISTARLIKTAERVSRRHLPEDFQGPSKGAS
jgi:hypothetical protein